MVEYALIRTYADSNCYALASKATEVEVQILQSTPHSADPHSTEQPDITKSFHTLQFLQIGQQMALNVSM